MLVQGKRPGGGSSSYGVELPGSREGGQCTRGGGGGSSSSTRSP